MSKGGKPTDAEPTRGETLRTLWTPAPVKQAEDTGDSSDVSEPVTLLAQIAQGTGGAGQAAIEAEAGAASPGSMATRQEVQPESPPEWGSGPESRSWWDSVLVSRSILPTVLESETSPGSRWDSWADSSSDDGGGRLSRPADTDNGVSVCGGKAKGWPEGAGKGEGMEKDEDVLADEGARAMPTWSTVAAGRRSDSEVESAGGANTDATGAFKRKRLEGDAASHGSVGKSRKRGRQLPGSDGRGPSTAPPPVVPVAVADEGKAAPEGSTFIRPFMGANIVEVYSPSDLCSVRNFWFCVANRQDK